MRKSVVLGSLLIASLVVFGLAACKKKPEPNVTYDSQSGTEEGGGSKSTNVGESDLGDGSKGGTAGGGSLTGLTTVYFEYDSATLSPESRRALDQNAKVLKNKGTMTVVVEGHCDERGSTQYNLALGERRANAVRDYLSALGVPKSRLKTISYGEERPAVAGSTEAAYSKNRRSEFTSN